MRLNTIVIITLCLFLWITPAVADVCGPTPQALIVLDRSGTMKQLVNGASKWSIALDAVEDLTTSFMGQLNFGLMLFPQWPHVSNCSSGKTNVNVGPSTAGSINNVLSSSYPLGDTPLSLTLDAARDYLDLVDVGDPQYVILITDGMETCSPDDLGQPGYNTPELAASKLLSDGVRTYVVGFGDQVDPASLRKTAQAGDTGDYFQADDLPELSNALKEIAGLLTCCGNGIRDPGELCDTDIAQGQPNACPLSCDDNNRCTEDKMIGSKCNATCSHVMVTALIDGDGCCPPGANSSTDSDCQASCGNGLLEPGEACDTAISSGHFGACPTDCSDGDACTADQILSSGCNAYCEHIGSCCGNGKVDWNEWCDTDIPDGAPGACPDSCDDSNSCTVDTKQGSDCKVYCTHTNTCSGDPCGNGSLDGGELCDPKIPTGNPDACPTSCGDGNSCTEDTLMGFGCQVYCVHDNTCSEEGCGNGTVDWDEECDVAIPAGSAGACPASCNDGVTCTVDTLTGSGCDAICHHSNTCSDDPCGNGIVDAGESCDVAIPAGAQGACPVACFDDSHCTHDILQGSGCTVHCVYQVVSNPQHDDGCCPPQANANEDNDCPFACGNGVQDNGEDCDTGIISGPGACNYLNCDDGDPCTQDFVTGGACTPECGYTPAEPNSGAMDGCCPEGLSVIQDADCRAACGPDKTSDCVDACQNVECEDGEYCALGECRRWPTDGSDPSSGLYPNPGITGGCDCQVSSLPTNLPLWGVFLLAFLTLRRRQG